METMNKKSQELELRNIMQGLEEFATFMSFRANNAGLRILSVESVEQAAQLESPKQAAKVINMPKMPQANDSQHAYQSLKKSISFQDRQYH